MYYDVIVIGGGASGLMSAITAKEGGVSVLLLEANERVGKKLLATGNGRCNMSHFPLSAEDYHTDDYQRLTDILKSVDAKELYAKFLELGIPMRNREGYLYPYSDQASTVLDALRYRLTGLGCEIKTGSEVYTVKKQRDKFLVLGKDFQYCCKAVVLAMGSKAGGFYKSKSNMPYAVGTELSLTSTDLLPALTRLHSDEEYFKSIAGVRANATLNVFSNNEHIGSESGEVQFTKTGISGIPVFQLSGQIALELKRKHSVYVRMDLLNEMNYDETVATYLHRKKISQYSDYTLEEFFNGILPKKLMVQCIKNSGFSLHEKTKKLTENEIKSIFYQMSHFTIEISRVDSLENAQVCRGGYSLTQFDNQLQFCGESGVFACGEVLNVDGKCGGFNLHFAWCSGILSGKSAVKYIGKKTLDN